MSEDTYPNAGRASGYTDEQGRAIGEDLVNRVTELMIGPQTKLIQLAAQVQASSDLQEQRFDYILNQFRVYLDKEDTRHDTYDRLLQQDETSTLQALTSIAQRLDEITGYVQQSVTIAREAQSTAKEALTVSKAGAARLGKLTTDVTELKRAMSESKEDRRRIHAEIAQLQARIDQQAEIERRLMTLERKKDNG